MTKKTCFADEKSGLKSEEKRAIGSKKHDIFKKIKKIMQKLLTSRVGCVIMCTFEKIVNYKGEKHNVYNNGKACRDQTRLVHY